jgi:hypothetical protein
VTQVLLTGIQPVQCCPEKAWQFDAADSADLMDLVRSDLGLARTRSRCVWRSIPTASMPAVRLKGRWRTPSPGATQHGRTPDEISAASRISAELKIIRSQASNSIARRWPNNAITLSEGEWLWSPKRA